MTLNHGRGLKFDAIRQLIALAILSLASCGGNILGTLNNTSFVLQSVDGTSLPATIDDPFGGLAWVVTADTIWLESGSKWRRHSVQHREPGIGGDPLDLETSGTVLRLAERSFIPALECDDTECVTPDSVFQTQLGLRMSGTYPHTGVNLSFRGLTDLRAR